MQPQYFPEIDPPSLRTWLADLKQSNAGVAVFALLPETENAHVLGIQAICNEWRIPLMGALFPALIHNTGFQTSGVIFLCFPKKPRWFLIEGLDTDTDEAASALAKAARGALSQCESPTGQQLFLVFDSMLPNTGSILVGLFEHLKHAVSYAGVSAGSESFQPMPCLFDNRRCVGNGVIGLLVAPEKHIAVAHAYPISKSLMQASSSAGNRIDKLDGQPAMSVYQQVIASEYGITLTAENFYDYAVHYPFGLIGTLDVLVRIPVAFTSDGSIFCVGEVPAKSMLRLLKAPSLPDSNCIEKLLGTLGPLEARPLLAFYCAGRRLHFGAAATQELIELMQKSGASSTYGALSLGEISTDSDLGIPQFHNAALVCLR